MYVQQPPGSIEDVLPPPGPPPHHRPSMENSSWTDEPATSAWEDVAPQHAAAAGAASDSIHRKEVPRSLRPGGGIDIGFGSPEDEDSVWNEARKQPSELNLPSQIPDALRPGVQSSAANPFLKNRAPSDTNLQAVPASLQPPAASLSSVSLDETGTNNPWKPAIALQPPIRGNELPVVAAPGDSEPDLWSPPTPEPPAKVPISPKSPDLISLHSRSSTWDDDSHSERDETGSPSQKPAMPDDLEREQHVWDDLGALDAAKGKGKVPELTAAQAAQLDDWSLIDSDPSLSPPPRQPQEEPSAAVLEAKPALPPRVAESRVKWVPSRPPVDGKAETYQVKNVRWHDPNSSNNPRVSPILIQNENGPCPLVALVNALTMTTPDDIPDTVLVQVLRSREQVSLSLLLDAVFDELMSPRRTSSEDSLPDVAELYSFLQSLHTGMNVNPRFIPTPEVITAYEHTSLTQLHPLERHRYIPGTFEDTAEMNLYATFSIPLVHGWLPPYDDVVCASMQRHATSYEDVQNLLFREEELEDKLATSEEGLTEAEQDLYQDIITIKIFLNESATQLTPWGIEVIQKAIRPGTFAILFRNDHFSTLYCHPQTHQLLTLVTDAGYRSHDEVVWESLMDVNGEFNQFLSGDYRLVSGDNAAEPSTRNDQSGGAWTTVTNKRGKTKETTPIEEQGQASSSTEQEDRDLALALQLQEEEDQKHREEQARRQRERALSEQYIEQAHLPIPVTRPEANSGGNSGGNAGGNNASRRSSAAGPSGSTPVLPPRRSSNSVSNSANNSTSALPASASQRSVPARAPASQTVRPLVPPLRPGVNRPVSSDEPPPPSYEQAAQVPAYVPPRGHPNHHESSPFETSPAASRQASRTSNGVGTPAATRGRRPGPSVPANRRSAVASTGSSSKSERDCIVM